MVLFFFTTSFSGFRKLFSRQLHILKLKTASKSKSSVTLLNEIWSHSTRSKGQAENTNGIHDSELYTIHDRIHDFLLFLIHEPTRYTIVKYT